MYICITKFQRIILFFGIYLTFKLSKYSKVRIPGLFLTMHLIFGLLKNILNLLGKVVGPKLDHLDQFSCPCDNFTNILIQKCCVSYCVSIYLHGNFWHFTHKTMTPLVKCHIHCMIIMYVSMYLHAYYCIPYCTYI